MPLAAFYLARRLAPIEFQMVLVPLSGTGLCNS
jgi:hypothetical protein